MQEVQKWMADVLMCPPETLPPEQTPLSEIEGWDSLRHVGLILGLEKKLNEKLTADQIRGIVTVGDVVVILRQKGADG
ncbi:MAG: acyl carrier protein [Bryobacteraceae bacterium]